MRFSTTIISFLISSLSLSAAAPIEKRTTALITDLSTVSADIATLTSGVQSFTGGIFQALGLLVDFNDLKSSIDTATTAAKASAALDTADSTTLTNTVAAIVPNILAVITDLEAKTNEGYTSDILSALNTLRNHSSLLFDAIKGIVDATDLVTITSYATEVYNALTTAIGDF